MLMSNQRVKLEPAEKLGFPHSFAENRGQKVNRLGRRMENPELTRGGARGSVGSTANGVHYARSYDDAASYPGFPKVPHRLLCREAKAAIAYPPRRQIGDVRLTAREHAYVSLLSCKSRVVFWLYYKLRWPARKIAETFGCSILDQHDVYVRNRPIKRSMLRIENKDKRVDYEEVRIMFDEGATLEELAEFYGLSAATIRKHLRAD